MKDITLDELRAMMGMGKPPKEYPRQITQVALCDEIHRRGLSRSKGQAKIYCIQGAITVNGTVERDFHRLVSNRDDVQKLTKSVGEGE
jgi:ribosome-associated protein YbcJ (S4-like RNA binding protein)